MPDLTTSLQPLELGRTGKACTKCGEWKPETEFYMDGQWRRGECKSCTKAKRAEHYRDNREAAIEYARQRRATPEGKIVLANAVARRSADPAVKAAKRAYNKAYYSNPSNKRAIIDGNNKRTMIRRKSDPLYAANLAARTILRRCMDSTGRVKTSSTFETLGYGPEKLRARIEMQFLPGMSWSNRGEWHIDHKKPVAAFLKHGVTDPKLINALCNLRPMWARENLSKGARWTPANDNTREKINAAA